MSPAELDKIIAEAPDKVRELLGELRYNIIEAAAATLTETQDSDTGKATLKVSIALAIELHCSPVSWTVQAGVAVRHTVKSESEIADTSPELKPNMGKGRKTAAVGRRLK